MQEANKPPDSWFELKVNSHVYVTGLPDDVTVDEVSHSHYFVFYEHTSCELKTNLRVLFQVVEVFSKCGIIKEVSLSLISILFNRWDANLFIY